MSESIKGYSRVPSPRNEDEDRVNWFPAKESEGGNTLFYRCDGVLGKGYSYDETV